MELAAWKIWRQFPALISARCVVGFRRHISSPTGVRRYTRSMLIACIWPRSRDDFCRCPTSFVSMVGTNRVNGA